MEQLRQRETTGNPWLKLRLPDGHEELIRSLIHSHFTRQRSGGVHFDLMRNKGKDIGSSRVPGFLPVFLTAWIGNGVTILLHGVPGVGKTSTAGRAGILLST